MAELEHLLLEAAGRTRTSSGRSRSNSQARLRHADAYSYDGSDSGDDDSDDQGFSSRKASGTQFPLKKRFDPPEMDKDVGQEDDDDDKHSDSDSGFSIGSDLYKDDEDREKLSKMSELERELILTERGEKRNDYWIKKKARDSAMSNKKARKGTPPPSRVSRSSVKSDKATPKDDALNELRARRMKQQDLETFPRLTRSMVGSEDAGAVGVRKSSPEKWRTPPIKADQNDSSSSEIGSRKYTSKEDYVGDNELINSDEDETVSGVTFDDIKGITIRRSKLAKWFAEPFFDELIVGCFVRVGIGMTRSGQSIYRLCMVKNVDATDPNRQYKLESRTTHKYLNCVWGSDASAARWQMARVSDSPPLLEEFTVLVREVEREGGRMPRKNFVLDKMEAIERANNFVYSAAAVKQMLQEKKSTSSKPFNVAAEKDRLRNELELAESKGDETEMGRIRTKLKELEEVSRQVKYKDEKAARLEAMNRKNREENFKNASQRKPVKTSLKAGEEGYDPFSRRWTRSRNYYASKPETEVDAATTNCETEQGPADPITIAITGRGEAGEVATAAALQAAAGAGKLVDTNAPVDQETNTLHNFEIPISLVSLQKFGGVQGVRAGFMARKQRIEAAMGCRVPVNDGRRHMMTLTVSDYKRRRGLL